MTTIERINNIQTLENLNTFIDDINNEVLDGTTAIADNELTALVKIADNINASLKKAFVGSFLTKYDISQKTAFDSLILSPSYTQFDISKAENGTIAKTDKTVKIKLSELEKAYQICKSVAVNSKGQPIANGSVSIFGSLRFYTVCDAFIRNLFMSNVDIEDNNTINLSKIKIGDKTIFDENDGECFGSKSNQALKKQLNVLVKFFGLDVEMFREDILPLKVGGAQKIKIDRTTNKVSVHENGKKDKKTNTKDSNILKFADLMFAVIATRSRFGGVKLYDASGEIIKVTEKATDNNTK